MDDPKGPDHKNNAEESILIIGMTDDPNLLINRDNLPQINTYSLAFDANGLPTKMPQIPENKVIYAFCDQEVRELVLMPQTLGQLQAVFRSYNQGVITNIDLRSGNPPLIIPLNPEESDTETPNQEDQEG